MKDKLLIELSAIKKLGPNGVKMILHHHNNEHYSKNPIQIIDLKDVTDTVKKTIRSHHYAEKADNCYQFIVKDGKHYNTIHLEVGADNKAQIIVMDAANDIRVWKLITEFSQLPEIERTFIPGGSSGQIQKDASSCSVFALTHAIQLQKTAIFDQINNIKKEWDYEDKAQRLVYLQWKHLPPDLIKNCQSRDFWNRYVTDHSVAFNKELEFFKEFTEYREYMLTGLKDGNFISRLFKIIVDPVIKAVQQTNETVIQQIILEHKDSNNESTMEVTSDRVEIQSPELNSLNY